jgi:hypothetical protein
MKRISHLSPRMLRRALTSGVVLILATLVVYGITNYFFGSDYGTYIPALFFSALFPPIYFALFFDSYGQDVKIPPILFLVMILVVLFGTVIFPLLSAPRDFPESLIIRRDIAIDVLFRITVLSMPISLYLWSNSKLRPFYEPDQIKALFAPENTDV